MKPAWDKLGGEYEGSSSVVIGDVDCTVHQDLCQRFEVRGYPTIKYFKDVSVRNSFHPFRECLLLRGRAYENVKESECADPSSSLALQGDKKGAAYSGGRDFDDLKKFVADTLEVKCDVKDPSNCSDREKKFMEKFKAKSADDVKKQLERLTRMSKGKMKADLKQWVVARLNILKQL